MKYRKKPVVIEAILFTGSAESIVEVSDFLGGVVVNYDEEKNPYISIGTLEGTMTAKQGDYIIRGVHGEFYPCKPDIFELTYEVAE